jgi:hypothetical protein
MSRCHLGRLLLVVVVATALVMPPAWALPQNSVGPSGPFCLLARLWDTFTAIWAAAGCGADPHGGCTDGTSTPPSTDEGCGIDPHGGCASSQSETPDAGCGLDPHGGCTPGS